MYPNWEKYCLTNITDKKRLFNSGGIFTIEPSSFDLIPLGYLFIVANFVNKKEGSLINNIIFKIKNEYYLKPERKPYESLEAALVKTNNYLAEIIEKGDIDWIGKLNFACLVLANNIVYYTQLENAYFYILRDRILTDPSKPFKNSKYNPLKPFSYIINGKIFENDILLLIAGNITDYIKEKDLKILFENNKEARLKEIKNKILQSKEEKRVDLVYITFTPQKVKEKKEEKETKINLPFQIEPLKPHSKKRETEPIILSNLINEIQLKKISSKPKIKKIIT